MPQPENAMKNNPNQIKPENSVHSSKPENFDLPSRIMNNCKLRSSISRLRTPCPELLAFAVPRAVLAFALCSAGVFLALLGFWFVAPKAAGQPLSAPQTSGAFTAVRPMFLARSFHTATLLGDGKVLITGGTITGNTYTNTVEKFDPATGSFSRLNPSAMTTVRSGHTATPLPNGRVLLAGGYNGSGINNTAELFDPISATSIAAGRTMTLARYRHTATLLPNGKVLIAGGDTPTGATNTAELFDPSAGTFTATTNTMSSARRDHTATLLSSGKVLIVGGSSGTPEGATAAVDIFDPSTGTFTALSPTTFARDRHTATLLSNGKVLIAGGRSTRDDTVDTAELFDPVSATFLPLPPMTQTRFGHTATLLADGHVLVAGGILTNGYSGYIVSNTAELFDPMSQTFTAVPNTMSSMRDGHTATLLADGKVLLAGGEVGAGTFDTAGVTNTAELFDPEAITPGTPPPSSAPAGVWSPVTSANPVNGDTHLQRITCASAENCWAVGWYQNLASGVLGTLIEHWDGVSWNIANSPNRTSSGDFLWGVNCTSASNCWAVGYSTPNAYTDFPEFATLAERWDGNSWIIIDSPNASQNGGDPAQNAVNFLWDVTCASASDCWAVGQHYNHAGSGGLSKTLAEHWDGNSWTIVNSPNKFDQNGDPLQSWLVKVTCSSGGDCWAVGNYYIPNVNLGDPGENKTLIERWDGTSWAIVESPNITVPGLLVDSFLYGVTCSSPTDCWAAGQSQQRYGQVRGGYEIYGINRTLLLHWDGNAWAIVPSPNVPFSDTGATYGDKLNDVACASANDCWAVGFRDGNPHTDRLKLHWDGTVWAVVYSPNRFPENTNYLYGVTCLPNSSCWAAGNTFPYPQGPFNSLIEVLSPTVPPLIGVSSRMSHGGAGPFDVDLPLTGTPGIECRSGGTNGNYELVFTFSNPLSAVGLASVTAGTGTVSSSAMGPNPNQYRVDLTGVTNAQYISVTLSEVLDSQNNVGDVSATMGVLFGDVNGNKTVSNTDVASVKAQVAATVNSSNFRNDVNANGTLSNTDVSATKAQVGTSLP
jgi:hypothetical protein